MYKMKLLVINVNFILFIFLFLFTCNGYAQDKLIETIRVKANKKVLDLIKTWDEGIWFFTSKDNPIRSLDNLRNDEVACWGTELAERVWNFFDAADIKYNQEKKPFHFIATSNQIFSGMENPPRLFITWSNYASYLKGAVKVEFVENVSDELKEIVIDLKQLQPNKLGGIKNTISTNSKVLETYPVKVIDVKENFVIIDADSSIGKIGDIIKVLRPINKDTIIIGYIKIFKFENRTSITEIVKEKKDFQIENGDLIGSKESLRFFDFSIGLLNRGAFKSSLEGIPYELRYPDNTGIINFCFLWPNKKGSLLGFWNWGFPLKKICIFIPSINVIEPLNMVSMFTDVGILVYPIKFVQSKSRIQPFIQGGIGLSIYADSWITILLLTLSGGDYYPGKYDFLINKININLQFSYGGGIDYQLSEYSGIRLSFQKHKFNLPGMGGSINPFEIHLGIFYNAISAL